MYKRKLMNRYLDHLSCHPYRWLASSLIAAVLSIPLNSALAGQWQSISSIENAARLYLQRQAVKNALDMDFKLGKLDPRLHLIQCAQDLSVSPRSKLRAGAMSLEVECRGNKPWKIYLPLQLTLWRNVLAASKPLPRGHQISAEDIITVREAQTNANQARYMQDQGTQLIGQILTRSQANGKPFDAKYLKAPLLVKRGQTVTLLAQTASIQIRMKGSALADGAKGDLIKVKNLSSRRIIEGIVVKSGVVAVTTY